MVLFLRDWGTSLVAGLVIPATLAVTFIALRLLGESFNLMTLGGLAAAVGLVIDDAIVVVENIVMHRDAGQTRGRGDPQRDRRDPRAARSDRRSRRSSSSCRSSRSRASPGTFFRALAVTVGVALLTSLGAGAHLDADAQPLSSSAIARARARATVRRQPRRRAAAADARLRARAPHDARASDGAGRRQRVLVVLRRLRQLSLSRHPICCPRWTKAASSSTTSCRPDRRSTRRTA